MERPSEEEKMGKYFPPRKWPRLVPTGSVFVSIDCSGSHTRGMLANISEAGACVVCSGHFERGSRFVLNIEVDSDKPPFTAESEVIWSRDETAAIGVPTFVHGVDFRLSDEHKTGLRTVLNRPNFRPPIEPDAMYGGAGVLHRLMGKLQDEQKKDE
jgi:hypothetical protein